MADAALAERFAAPPVPKADQKPEQNPDSKQAAGTGRKTLEEVKTEAAQLQARLENWVYTVPEFKAEPLIRRMDELLAPKTVGPPQPR
jgi:hypothetical protein